MTFTITQILLLVLIGLAIAALVSLFQVLIVRVNISIKAKRSSAFTECAFIQMSGSEGTGDNVKLIALPKEDPIGRVVVKDSNAWVEIAVSNSSTGKLTYKKYGYVDEEGYVYRAKKDESPIRIGYLATPSKPNKPTLVGERYWKELWLYKHLNAYLGEPGLVPEPDSKEKKKKGKQEASKAKSSPQTKIQTEEETQEQIILEKKENQSYGALKNHDDSSFDGLNINVVDDSSAAPLKEQPTKNIAPEPAPTIPVEVRRPRQETKKKSILIDNGEPDYDDESADINYPNSETSEPLYGEDADKEAMDKLLARIRLEHPDIIEEILDSLVKVEGGSFLMGADPDDSKENYVVEPNESPKHKVSLDTFYIAKYPVTQKIWTAIMEYNPSEEIDDTYPVAPVDWTECAVFIERLRKLTGLDFALPTEAQWEYAARGGQSSSNYIYSGGNDFNEVGWNNYAVPVGKKKPNELGLYDMSGLVREWTADWYYPYTEEEQYNPSFNRMPEDPESRRRVVRSPAGNCTVTNRKSESPTDLPFKSYGFRLVCNNIKEADIQKKKPAVLVGKVKKRGIFGSKSLMSGFSDESRGAAYAIFSHLYEKRRYDEYADESPYGWLDTALISAFIFAGIYLAVYFVNSVILQFPMYDDKHIKLSANILTLFYFVTWVIVRTIKVSMAEMGNTIQPKLDLFNRSRGVLFFDLLLIFMCAVLWMDADFIPVARAILIGTVLNLLSGKTRVLWLIKNPYVIESEIEYEADEILPPPPGDKMIDYEWDLDSFEGRIVHSELSINFFLGEIENLRNRNPFYIEMPKYDYKAYVMKMKDFVLDDPDSLYRVRYLAQEIKRIASRNKLSELDTVQFVLDFIQMPNIKYVEDKDSSNIAKPVEYMRFPDETLFDKEGDCDCKSFLAFILYHVMGFDVMFMLSDQLKHAAVGVALKGDDWKDKLNLDDSRYSDVVYVKNGREYVYCETTNDKFKFGDISKGESITQFETRIELLWEDEED